MVQHNMILHTELQKLRHNINQEFVLTTDTLYLAFTGELEGGCCEDLGLASLQRHRSVSGHEWAYLLLQLLDPRRVRRIRGMFGRLAIFLKQHKSA